MAINNEYVPIDNQPTIKPRTVTGIFTRYIAKTLPLAFDESMSYYECLCALLEYLNETIVPDINNVNEGLEEIQNLYITLQEYINNAMEEFENSVDDKVQDLEDFMNNYFDNLDVQEEINNKLDDMVEAGTLQEIIADYLNSKAIFGFDNLASMKSSTNLINGSYAKTLGYYSKNDGGSALYKIRTITNDDVVDEMFIIEMTNDNTLIAELIDNDPYVNIRKLGIRETETGNISVKLNSIISKLNTKGQIPYIPLINIDTTLEIPMSAKIKIDRLNYTGNNYAISLSQGINGNIQIEYIYSLTGSGVHIDPTGEYSGNGYYQFNKIAVNGYSVYFDNDSTIVNSTFEGIQWYSRLNNCFVIKPKENAVIGQCNFKVNNYYAVDNIGVVIDTTDGSLTNLDFGYSSVEGSTNGILVNLVNYTEGIKGYFRVNEVGSHANNQYVLKIKGAAQQIRNQIDLTFDSYRYDKIDLSELTMNLQSSRANPNILIQGKCFNGVGDVIGYSGRVMNNRLCMDYVNATVPYNLTATVELNYETSNSTPRVSSNFTTGSISDNIFVTLPKSLKPGVISSLINNSGHNVTIKPYGNPSSTGVLFSSSALFTTMIDGNGNCQVIKL